MKEDDIGPKVEKKVEDWAKKMENKDCGDWKKEKKKGHFTNSAMSAVYCLGFIGAAVYYIGHAENFGWGVVGFLQALVWPAFVVYDLLNFIHM
ncbi:hypothetical protein ACFL2B_02795 [Patescibacteria group bacterium]